VVLSPSSGATYGYLPFTPFAGAHHSIRDVGHREDFDFADVSPSHQLLEHALEHRQRARRFGQIIWMKTKVEDPARGDGGFNAEPKAA
jgi:hypothetical protein